MPALDEVAAGDWVVRVSGGTTKRVNSANPIVSGARVEAVRGLAEARYRAAGLPARFRLTPLAADGADAALERSGYAVIDASADRAVAAAARGEPYTELPKDAYESWKDIVVRFNAKEACAGR